MPQAISKRYKCPDVAFIGKYCSTVGSGPFHTHISVLSSFLK